MKRAPGDVKAERCESYHSAGANKKRGELVDTENPEIGRHRRWDNPCSGGWIRLTDKGAKTMPEDYADRPLARPESLTAAAFAALGAVPPELEWFANLHNAQTRRAYRRDVQDFAAFAGLQVSVRFDRLDKL